MLDEEPERADDDGADAEREQARASDVDAADRELGVDEGRDVAVFRAEGEEERLLDDQRDGERDHQHRELRLPHRPDEDALDDDPEHDD